MYKGIYISLSGAVLKQKELDTISQNLANTKTTGYKKDRMAFKDFLIRQKSGINEGFDGRTMSEESARYTDQSEGYIVKTNNPFDVALNGEGFFAIEGNKYTRRGDFQLNSEGMLVTKDGEQVLGENGPIQLPRGNVYIGAGGEISVNDAEIDTLSIVNFPNQNALIKQGGGMFTTDQAPEESEATVHHGFIESSNVNPVTEMVLMIKSMREFETYQKSIQMFDEAAAKVSNEMARI